MKTIHHFGDSYAVRLFDENYKHITTDSNNTKTETLHIEPIKNFIEIAAEQLNYRYVNEARGGESNEMILDRLINHLNEFNKGDILFINFSFFSRGCWYDENSKKIKSTNNLYNDVKNIKQFYNVKNQYVIELVEYYLNHTIDYNKRIFKLINSLLKNIESNGITIFYIFIEESEWSDNLIDVGTSIRFPDGFCKWLIKNNLHFEQEGHYTRGIQPILSSMILNKTKNLTEINKIINVDFGDINWDAQLKKPIKINLL